MGGDTIKDVLIRLLKWLLDKLLHKEKKPQPIKVEANISLVIINNIHKD